MVGFHLSMLALWVVTSTWITQSVLHLLEARTGSFFSRSWFNISYLVLLCWALIAFKDLWRVFIELRWFICWWIKLTVKKTLFLFNSTASAENIVVWDDRLAKPKSCADDCDMDRLLQKEEDTRRFRIARRIMSKRRGWMLKSRAFKVGMWPVHRGSVRLRSCSYLFSSKWQKFYSIGMQRKRKAQTTWRRLRFWMKKNPCLRNSLRTLNIKLALSDLISVLDYHPEWFSEECTCLEAGCIYFLCAFITSSIASFEWL